MTVVVNGTTGPGARAGTDSVARALARKTVSCGAVNGDDDDGEDEKKNLRLALLKRDGPRRVGACGMSVGEGPIRDFACSLRQCVRCMRLRQNGRLQMD